MSEERLNYYKEWIIENEEIVVDSGIFEELYNEVIRLKELDENYPIEEELAEAYRREEDYKTRIDKAIEYIENNEVCCLKYIGRNEIIGNLEKQIQRDLVNKTDLLNILRGKV